MRFSFFCLILVLALCGGSAVAVDTPDKTLAGIQLAIDSNNSTLLDKYMDVRGIITRGVDTFVADFKANPPSGEGDPLLEMLSGGLASESRMDANQPMRMLLIEETRKFVVWGVASGHFSGRPSTSQALPDGGILSALFSDASIARKELRSFKVAPPKGDRTTAVGKLYDHGSERSYPVQVSLALQPQGHWRVTEVTNMAELIRTVRKEAEAR